jgi:hypothetical protein
LVKLPDASKIRIAAGKQESKTRKIQNFSENSSFKRFL